MPELARALAFRLFGTRQLALASSLRLAGIAWLLGSMPDVLLFAARALFQYVLSVGGLTAVGLLAFILPGLFIALVGVWIGGSLLVLFVRGYVNLGIRSYNWLYTTYSLAQEDVALNAHFARQDSATATTAPTPDELAQLHAQLADKERLIASLEGTIASKEEIISLLRGGYNRPN